ncbi:unnamed protein product [Echinostoma caproni]|uniref:Secreted protein n=1 Tax=Echinostoma caproni TaxID=27848 RepID=A0A183A3H8_9TREM|nr:unnamed protein product [Echinostoma caproni]
MAQLTDADFALLSAAVDSSIFLTPSALDGSDGVNFSGSSALPLSVFLPGTPARDCLGFFPFLLSLFGPLGFGFMGVDLLNGDPADRWTTLRWHASVTPTP